MYHLKQIPKLRFAEFENNWESMPLERIGRIVTGSTPPTTDISNYGHEYDFVGPGDMNFGRYVANSKSKLSRKGFIRSREVEAGSTLVVCIGSTIGKVAQTKKVIATNQQINSIVPNPIFNQDFVYLAMYRMAKKIALLAGQQAVPMLSKTDFSKINIFITGIEEQKRIVGILNAVDEKIQILQQKVELTKKYKKGVMQQVFSQKIRFRDSSGKLYAEWQQKRVGDIFDRVTSKNTLHNQNIMTISSQQGLVSQTDYFNKVIAAKNTSNYYLLNRDDFAYNKSYSTGYPMGAIKRLNNYDHGVVSTLYICFRAKNNKDGDFFEHVFDFGLQNEEIGKFAQEGARNHGLLNIAVGDFFDIHLRLPTSADEQEKITKLFNVVSNLEELQRKKLVQVMQFKKLLLQKMFV